MSPILTICHYIFLNKQQRYVLSVPESELEVVGCFTKVWSKNGKHLTEVADEMFGKYKIRHCPEPEKQTVNIMEGHFLIRLSPDMPKYLLDYSDGGSAYLHFTHKNVIKIKNELLPVVHFFSFEDSEVLEKTLC